MNRGREALVKVNNEVRVSIYLLFGIGPSVFGTLFSVLLGYHVLTLALLGTAGLVMATFKRFPLSRATYWWTAGLLMCGLSIASMGMWLTFLRVWEKQAWDSSNNLAMMLFGGPMICAIHALIFGRPRSVRAETASSTTSA